MVLILLTVATTSQSRDSRARDRDVPDTWKVADAVQTNLLHELLAADTGALEDLRGTESATAQDDALACADNGLLELTAVGTVLRGDVRDADGLVAFEDHTGYPRIGAKVQVRLDIHDTVNVS